MSEWHEQAACKDPSVSPEWFFPDEDDNTDTYQHARLICAGCPVVQDCLVTNLDAPVGIFGGLDEYEREAIAAGRAIPVRGELLVPPDYPGVVTLTRSHRAIRVEPVRTKAS